MLGDIADLELASGIRPSRFEILTLAAFRWFADVAVNVVVLEVGLGGTWDATNVADATVAVVTNIELDHTLTLGPARADVAGEKSGIVKSGSTLACWGNTTRRWSRSSSGPTRPASGCGAGTST